MRASASAAPSARRCCHVAQREHVERNPSPPVPEVPAIPWSAGSLGGSILSAFACPPLCGGLPAEKGPQLPGPRLFTMLREG